MKTAISIPDELFAEADALARRLKKSRSELYSRALAEFLARHSPDEVTEALNQVCTDVGEEDDSFRKAAVRRALERIEW